MILDLLLLFHRPLNHAGLYSIRFCRHDVRDDRRISRACDHSSIDQGWSPRTSSVCCTGQDPLA
jgi:hypothetical protein